jgi:hypothetical protein
MRIKPAKLAALCLIAAVAAILLVSFCQRTFAQTAKVDLDETVLNTVSLNFNTAQINPSENNQVVRAFVPTGSTSVNCLVSLNEQNSTSFPVVFCGERNPFAFGGVPGVLVSVFYPEPVPPDFVLSVTLYQKGARKYGVPVLCNGNDGC